MSQSIRIFSGLSGPILQHIPNTSSSSSSSSCLFLSTECRKRAAGISMVSNCNRLPFLPCAATLKSDVDDGGTSSKGRHDPQVTKEVVVQMIRMDRHGPIYGLRVLLDLSRAWRRILSITRDELYDDREFDDHYGKNYIRKARTKGGTYKGKHKVVKNSLSRITTRLSIIRLLADLHDPNDGLEVLLGALELWRTVFSSNELNDSEDYLQKEISAIRNLSHRISVSNRNGKYDAAKNPPSQLTHLLTLFKLMIDNFKDPRDAVNAMWEAFRRYDEGEKCDATSGSLVAAVAKVHFG